MENKIIQETLGICGKLIAFSKSGYKRIFPKNLVIFNSNIFLEEKNGFKKIWFGDLDITKDLSLLQEIYNKIQKTIYVLYEMDGRFENEDKPNIDNYVIKINDKIEINEKLKEYFEYKNNIIKLKNGSRKSRSKK